MGLGTRDKGRRPACPCSCSTRRSSPGIAYMPASGGLTGKENTAERTKRTSFKRFVRAGALEDLCEQYQPLGCTRVLLVHDIVARLLELALRNLHTTLPQREQTRFGAHRLNIGAGKLILWRSGGRAAV
eukprot:scaffold5391_cov121-Isochrysis_galbana.AAC.3